MSKLFSVYPLTKVNDELRYSYEDGLIVQGMLAKRKARFYVKNNKAKSFFMYCEDTYNLYLYKWYKTIYSVFECHCGIYIHLGK
jgi:hypothetical protein